MTFGSKVISQGLTLSVSAKTLAIRAGNENMPGMIRSKRMLLMLLLLIVAGASFYTFGRSLWMPIYYRVAGRRTIEQAIADYGSRAEERLKPHFQTARVTFPPASVTLI